MKFLTFLTIAFVFVFCVLGFCAAVTALVCEVEVFGLGQLGNVWTMLGCLFVGGPTLWWLGRMIKPEVE